MSRRTGAVTASGPGTTADSGLRGAAAPARKKQRTTAPGQTKVAHRRPVKSAMTDDSEERRGPTLDDNAQFEISQSEGNTFRNMGQYRKAINSYTKALELQPEHKLCLLARSACYQQIGDNRRALADANKTLEDGNNFIRGLLQKADVYYQMSEFEYALMYYHRGSKIRPEMQAFRLGVQKAQEAINNCIGENAGIKLNKSGDLSFFAEGQKPETSKRREEMLAASRPEAQLDSRSARSKKTVARDSKTVKQLLGELYKDKEYLENLLRETEKSHQSKPAEEVMALATVCLDYLDTRTEFWHQQQPTYSRERDRQMQAEAAKKHSSIKKNTGQEDPTDYIIRNLKWIDTAMAQRKYGPALERSKKVLIKAEKWTDKEVNSRQELISNLHSYAGNALLELGKYDQSLEHHQIDHDISEKCGHQEGLSRAKDNLARVYMRKGDYETALKLFEEKLPLSATQLENAWLFHEIGRCYLEMGDVGRSKSFGAKSLDAAVDADDKLWQLNSRILIAQSEFREHNYDMALASFQLSLDIASTLEDTSASEAIEKAISDVKKQMRTGSSTKVDRASYVENKTNDNANKPETDVTDCKVADDPDKPAGDVAASAKTKNTEDSKTSESNLNKTQLHKEVVATDEKSAETTVVSSAEGIKPSTETKDTNTPETKLTKAATETVTSAAGKTSVYKIIVRISDVEDAGTEEDIYVEITGDLGNTRRITLDQSETSRPAGAAKFERGKTEEFTVNSIDVGKVNKLKIGLGSTAPGVGCHITDVTVEVTSVNPSVRYVFACNDWLDNAKGDGRIERELTLS